MGKPTLSAAPLWHPRYWSIWLLFAIQWLVGQLPWRLQTWLGRCIGWLAWHLARRRRHIARTNIRLCFPELSAAEQDALARASVIDTGITLAEMCGTYWQHWSDFSKRVDIRGLEHLHAAQARGKGVLLLGMHFNTLDMAGRMVALATPCGAVYRPNDNPALDWLIRTGRSQYLDSYIDRSDIRTLVKRLKQGHTVWYAPDQDYGVKFSVFAPFFGVPAATITATSRIARLSGATIVPLAHYRRADSTYVLEFLPIVEDFPSGDDVTDATRINRIIEQAVRKAPAQYLWVHRRFKHRPEGEARFY